MRGFPRYPASPGLRPDPFRTARQGQHASIDGRAGGPLQLQPRIPERTQHLMAENEDGRRGYRGFGPRPDGLLPLSHGLMDATVLPPPVLELFSRVPQAAGEPFVGITTDGHVVPELFALQDTGWN